MSPVQAQVDSAQTPVVPQGAPVVFRGDTLFYIQAHIGPFSPADRARAAQDRLERAADAPTRKTDSVYVVYQGDAAEVRLGEVIVTSVLQADALSAGIPRDSLAAERAAIIAKALASISVWGIIRTILIGLAFALLATALLVVAIKLMNRFFPAVEARFESWRGTRVPAIRLQRLVLLSSERATDVLILGARVTRIALIALLIFWYIPLLLNFFPWTEPYANRFFEWVLTPLRQVGVALLGYIPNVFYIAVIVAVTYYGLKFIQLFFNGISSGALHFSGFYAEWADPTYKIVRFLVMAFALVIIFPYLPGSGSDAFKGVSVFFGVLLSLGSAGAIGNMIAGVVITYMRPFELGDRVKIADTTGDVIERTLLVTRVRTSKNVDITIPNAMVLSSHIINYSSTADDGGVILHTGVTIGYDVPWKQVHSLLLDAAARTSNLMPEPKPFVLQTSLDDFYVSYELNVYTEAPSKMPRIYSELHQHIQDAFNEAGVEIMSPHYGAHRDGNQVALPQDYLPKSYQAPGFRLFKLGGGPPPTPGGGEPAAP
ncbi:MAG: mechanosensitive ion channel family protein [Gemmatimonadota bacterium]|nr:mechanosensitive ion channel family protein [Gemmatimonadota bacterium]MDH5196084.1 mechanosensitive ion channel family protein [Gemmatimonadota bacterium]